MNTSPHIHLASQDTEPVNKHSNPLSPETIDDLKKSIFTWDLIDVEGSQRLCNEFHFASNNETDMFIERINKLADNQNHHPEITRDEKQVRVEWWTHSLDGLHKNDFIMAAKTQEIFENWAEITGKRDEVDIQSEESFPASDAPGNY